MRTYGPSVCGTAGPRRPWPRPWGVTAQAVSRWEKGICCPDMELIPSLANCFGVSIDELFGYDNERTKKVEALAAAQAGDSGLL